MNIRNIRTVFNQMVKPLRKTQTPRVKPYELISKEVGLSADSLKISAERIGIENAATADIVVIRKTQQPEQQKVITTFRDSAGNIVERVFEYIGVNRPEKHRLYRPLHSYFPEKVTGKLVQTFENININGTPKAWCKTASEKFFVNRNEFGQKDYVTIAKVTTDERSIYPIKVHKHSLTQYPVPIAHVDQNINKKNLSFVTKMDENGIPQIQKITSDRDVLIPRDDEYLAFRMFDSEDAKKPVTNYALKKRNLHDLGIRVEDNFYSSEKTTGSFNHDKGVIFYNYRYLTKEEVVDTAFHETTHAKQYEVMGRTKTFGSKYSTDCLIKHGEDNSPAAVEKGKAYYEAHKNYVPAEVDYEKYRKNLLEKEAWAEGEKAVDDYLEQGWELRYEFPNTIPEEL